MIFRSEIISYDGFHSNGISNEDSKEYEVDVHKHAISCDSIFPKIFHQLVIKQHSDDRSRDIGQ